MKPSIIDLVKDYCEAYNIETKTGPGAPTLNGVEISEETIRSLFNDMKSTTDHVNIYQKYSISYSKQTAWKCYSPTYQICSPLLQDQDDLRAPFDGTIRKYDYEKSNKMASAEIPFMNEVA